MSDARKTRAANGAPKRAAPAERAPLQAAPLTVSRPELLADGSDREFRQLVHALFGFLARHEAVRAGHAARIGLAGVEYSVLISIGHLDAEERSVSVNRLATHLHLSGAFITTLTNKLERLGLVSKEPDDADRRRVKLRITAEGWRRLSALAPVQRQVNDVQFGPLTAGEFRLLNDIMGRLIDSSERALKLQAFLADPPASEQAPAPLPAATAGKRKG
ncbi:MarR family winged helix-turn-helix transcriptional regulator [Xanthobacter sp. KR7-225]|uniref:MarR family winged helix-turn-helix transcriptional regulator n=1 Tax=Xanthobacter sp. KR7-225 TaxID=3156613 RepID=UPI0032B45460